MLQRPNKRKEYPFLRRARLEQERREAETKKAEGPQPVASWSACYPRKLHLPNSRGLSLKIITTASQHLTSEHTLQSPDLPEQVLPIRYVWDASHAEPWATTDVPTSTQLPQRCTWDGVRDQADAERHALAQFLHSSRHSPYIFLAMENYILDVRHYRRQLGLTFDVARHLVSRLDCLFYGNFINIFDLRNVRKFTTVESIKGGIAGSDELNFRKLWLEGDKTRAIVEVVIERMKYMPAENVDMRHDRISMYIYKAEGFLNWVGLMRDLYPGMS